MGERKEEGGGGRREEGNEKGEVGEMRVEEVERGGGKE